MPRRKKSEDFIAEDEEELEYNDDDMNEKNDIENGSENPVDLHIPSLWQHFKPKSHGKRLDWRDWTKDAEPVQKDAVNK